MYYCSKVYVLWCMQVTFIRLIFCGQMYELLIRKTGCNYRKISELQPVIKIRLFRELFLYCSLRRSQSGNRHTERRAAYIIQAYFVAEFYRRWLTTMLAANTAFQIGTNGTTLFCCHTYKLTYTILVEYLERIDFQNLLLQINRQEGGDIIT